MEVVAVRKIPVPQGLSARLALEEWFRRNPNILPCEDVRKLPEWLECVAWANKQIYVNVRR